MEKNENELETGAILFQATLVSSSSGSQFRSRTAKLWDAQTSPAPSVYIPRGTEGGGEGTRAKRG